ncbi:MAG TPA: amino acid permease [Actinomycetospora sp.]|nr:amino acid permease [Actinomycetospora sp.]
MAVETGADATPGHEGGDLQRSIGLGQLAAIGIGATVGTGIFFVLSEATPEAGPAVVLSFVIAAITAGLTALCYAELASAVPVAGSSYSYAYATLGEAAAMGVAACLILEYLAGLSWITWIVFAAWVGVVLVFWASYGARHSRLARTGEAA